MKNFKNIFIKRVIPFICTFSLLIGITCFPVGAEEVPYILWGKDYQNLVYDDKTDLNTYTLTPSTCRCWFESLTAVTYKEASPTIYNSGVSVSYLYQFSFGNAINDRFQNIFFNVNLSGDGFPIRANVPYYFKMYLLIPTVYSLNGRNGWTWHPADFEAYGYSWKFVNYPNNDYLQGNINLISPTMLELQNVWNVEGSDLQYKFPMWGYLQGSDVEYSMICVMGRYVRSSDMKLQSFGFKLPVGGTSQGYYGRFGIVDFSISVPQNYVYTGDMSTFNDPLIDYRTFNGSFSDKFVENDINNAFIDSYIEVEEELLAENAINLGALSGLWRTFKSVTSDEENMFVRGLKGASAFFGYVIDNNTWVYYLLIISLSLGFIGFVAGAVATLSKTFSQRDIRNDSKKDTNKSSSNSKNKKGS